MQWLLLIAAAVVVVYLVHRAVSTSVVERAKFIRRYSFPSGAIRKLSEHFPSLSATQQNLVTEALRDYFLISLMAQRRLVSMPSKAVDELWHEFILSTREYQSFCKKAFGYFLHHVPAEAMGSSDAPRKGIRLCWKLACRFEGINPKTPDRLPRLFRVDGELGIEGGYRYELDCTKGPRSNRDSYCASHIGCGGSGCAGSGSWDQVADSAGSDAGGLGDGGSSCGGGGGD